MQDTRINHGVSSHDNSTLEDVYVSSNNHVIDVAGCAESLEFTSESFQLQCSDYTVMSSPKLYSGNESSTFQARCCESLSSSDCDSKGKYKLEMNFMFCNVKQFVNQLPENNGNIWIYNVERDISNSNSDIPVHASEYFNEVYKDDKGKQSNNADLWQLYQELLYQRRSEEKLALSDEQRLKKSKEIGRIRAKLYRAKLRQNEELWKKHKADRAQKQREERQKLSEEQKEKIKELARIRARKHREKLKKNEIAWMKYKKSRAEKQRLERLRVKEEQREEAERQELLRLAEHAQKVKALARERAKKHRDRLKENPDAWLHYKEARAQKKRQERLSMDENQRERLKSLARMRAKKYREKLRQNTEEWRRYKAIRARKQREDRMKLNEEQREKAKELARARAKSYRVKKKRIEQRISSESENSNNLYIPQNWFDCGNEGCSNNCSMYFYHTYLQNVTENAKEP